MPLIARVDDRGVLTAVETVADAAAVTDVAARTIRLHPHSDLDRKIGRVRYDWSAGRWVDAAEAWGASAPPALDALSGLIEAIEDIYQRAGVAPAERAPAFRRLLAALRREGAR